MAQLVFLPFMSAHVLSKHSDIKRTDDQPWFISANESHNLCITGSSSANLLMAAPKKTRVIIEIFGSLSDQLTVFHYKHLKLIGTQVAQGQGAFRIIRLEAQSNLTR